MARPSKLTDEAVSTFMSAISAGNVPEVAARFAGFSAASFYRYMQAKTPEANAFREAVLRERAKLEVQLSATLMRGALRDPRLALRILALLFPERWAPRPPREAADAGPADTAPPARELVSLDPSLVGQLVPRLLEVGERLRAAENSGDPRPPASEPEPGQLDPGDEEAAT